MKDTEQLIKDLDTYAAAAKAKYPAIDAVVTKVKKSAQNHVAFLQDIVKAKAEYPPRYAEAAEAYKLVKETPTGPGPLIGEHRRPTPKALAAKLQRLKGCVDAFALIDAKWEVRRPKVQSMFQICDSSPIE